MKRKARRKHSLHGKTAASVLPLKTSIDAWCNLLFLCIWSCIAAKPGLTPLHHFMEYYVNINILFILLAFSIKYKIVCCSIPPNWLRFGAFNSYRPFSVSLVTYRSAKHRTKYLDIEIIIEIIQDKEQYNKRIPKVNLCIVSVRLNGAMTPSPPSPYTQKADRSDTYKLRHWFDSLRPFFN